MRFLGPNTGDVEKRRQDQVETDSDDDPDDSPKRCDDEFESTSEHE